MTDRRASVVDAAVRVLAHGGTRALTHRAVDAEAGAPVGTTSNHFRSRSALVGAVADAIEARDVALAAQLDLAPVAVVADVARLASRFVAVQLADPGPQRARLALAVEPGIDLAPQHDRLRALLVDLLSGLAVDDVDGRARALVDYLDGVLFHALTIGTRTLDPDEVERAVLRLLA
ncbi:TetR/AcrR family transcriptional regulator [Mariniluteicoccus flavus]